MRSRIRLATIPGSPVPGKRSRGRSGVGDQALDGALQRREIGKPHVYATSLANLVGVAFGVAATAGYAASSARSCRFAAGGAACRPIRAGIGAEPRRQEHRRPSTRPPTDASRWRSITRRSIAWLVLQPGQKASSHGVRARRATLIVGDHSEPRPAVRDRFHRSMTAQPPSVRPPPPPASAGV